MKNKAIAIFTCLLLTAFPAHAEWSKIYDIEFAMGDGDNRNSARQAALLQLKMKASEEAGTYIQNTTTLQNSGDLTQSIQVISAAMIKLSDVHDTLSLKNGQAMLLVNAKATVDEAELARRVKAMQQDKEKERQLNLLKAENDQLKQGFEKIRGMLMGSNTSDAGKLLTQQDAAIQKLTQNQESVGQIFTEGTLLDLADQNVVEFENIKAELDEKFFQPLMDTPVSANLLTVRKEGDKYVALVKLGWNIDADKYMKLLSPYLKVRLGEFEVNQGGLSFTAYNNRGNKGPHYLSEQIYDYLGSRSVNVKLEIGGKVAMFPVFYGDNSRMLGFCESMVSPAANNPQTICLVSQNGPSHAIHSSTNGLTNPVRIVLTKEQAERANRIEGMFVEF